MVISIWDHHYVLYWHRHDRCLNDTTGDILKNTILRLFLGGGIQAGLSANRNVVCLEESELELRKSAAMINSAKAAEGGEQEKSEDEIDGEGTVELTQDGEN